LSICQLHILLSRTAQISLELHTKKPWFSLFGRIRAPTKRGLH